MPRPKPIIVPSTPLNSKQSKITASADLSGLFDFFRQKKRKSNLIEDFKEARGEEQTIEGLQQPSEAIFQDQAAPSPQFSLDALSGLTGGQPEQEAPQPQLNLNALTRAVGGVQPQPEPEQPFRLTDLAARTPEVDIPEQDVVIPPPMQQVAAFRGLVNLGGPQSAAAIAEGFGDIAFGTAKEKVDKLFALINPKDFTQDSVGKFENSGRRADLVPRVKEGAKRFGGKSQFDRENLLRDEYIALSTDFRQTRDANARIIEAGTDPSAAGDLALIFNFMKMLDPNSVVRESEFATAENAAGIPEKTRRLWNKVLEGEKLGPIQRQDFLGRAKSLFSRQEAQHEQRKKAYTGLSERANVNPKNVTIDISDPIFELEKLKEEEAGLLSKGAR